MTNLLSKNLVFKAVLLAAPFLTVFADNALANKITLSINSGYNQSPGGEFTYKGADAAAIAAIQNIVYPGYASSTEGVAGPWSFQSFCIEYNEFINDGQTYDYAVSTSADSGGVAGGNPDHISIGTEYLYQQFALGSLAGYNYAPGAGRQASAAMLQQAFWYLEQEISLTSAQIAANTFLTAAFALFTNEAGAKANDTANLYGVFALNLTQNGVKKQDQLVYGDLSRTTTSTVPDGGLTLMMFGVGLSGLAVLRRKLV